MEREFLNAQNLVGGVKKHTNRAKKMPLNENDLNEIPEDAIVYLRTVQVAPFRTLIESLQNILDETTFIVDKKALRMCETDKSENCICVVTLYGFEHHYLHPDYSDFELSFKFGHLHRNLRYENPDMLVIYVSRDSPNEIYFVTHNSTKRCTHTNPVRRLDINKKRFIMSVQPTMTRHAIMPHADFQKSVKMMASINNEMAIRSQGGSLVFVAHEEMGDGTFLSKNIKFDSIKSNLHWKKINYHHGPNDFENWFPVRYLDKFCKTALNKHVNIYLREQTSLVLMYMIGQLGTVHFFLSYMKARSSSHPRTETVDNADEIILEDGSRIVRETTDEEKDGESKREIVAADDDGSLAEVKARLRAEEERYTQQAMAKRKKAASSAMLLKKPRMIKRSRRDEGDYPASSSTTIAAAASLLHHEPDEWASSGEDEDEDEDEEDPSASSC